MSKLPKAAEGPSPGAFFRQETPISVPSSGTATPYASQITIDHGGLVTSVEVRLTGVTHTRPDDLDIMLVGPTGTSVVLMSDAGGDNDFDNFFLRFNDPGEFTDPLPDEDPVTGEDFQPTNYGAEADSFPEPAPTPSDATDFSGFVGTPAAGAWSLYVLDDTAGETGEVDEWALEVGLTGTHYPSELQVSGIGTVSDVDVVIHGFSSECSDDANLLLVGPQGQQTALLSDAGGCSFEDVDDLELRFDDEALHIAPRFEALEGTTYQPTDYDGGEDGGDDDEYPAPAPPTPGPGGEPSTLSVFDGTDPNGTWRLFAYDDIGEFLTRIDAGWSLDIAWADDAAPSGTVRINGSRARTNSRLVELTFTRSDPQPGTGVTHVRLSNDGVTWTPYQPYSVVKDWKLPKTNGRVPVYAQFKDAAGNQSEVVRDTIVLDTVAPRAIGTFPAAGATGVAPATTLRVRVSEQLLLRSLTQGTVPRVVLDRDGVAVAAALRTSNGGRTIVVDPDRPLQPGRYVLFVSTRVVDLARNHWDQKPLPALQPLKLRFEV